MNKNQLVVIILAIIFCLPSAFAKRFTSQFCEFELPPGWECSLEGSEWVCQSANKDRKREAIIILAAKTRGKQDSLDQYQAYLKNRKTYSLPGGKTQVSEPKYVKSKSISGQQWIDALHLASEVPGFYTRYLATVKESLGVAVTFSVAKDHYSSYQAVFEKVVQTLRVFAQKQGSLKGVKLKGQDDDLLSSTYIPEQGEFDVSINKRKGGSGGGGNSDTLLLGLLLAAVVGFIIWKKKQGK
ncbi:MAG: hypothetical protein HOE90_01070 [Bacteriovoracaceae bacterium]|jgi:hypothetical protein|nr:hypothetical protein [Bacteriovoracaceae bacterium]